MSLFGARTWVGRGFGFTKWGIAGPSGFFANSGEFSLLMAIVAVMSIGFLIGFNKQKSIYILLPITATMTVLGASSRGSQIAIIIGLIYLVILYRMVNFKYLITFAFVGYVGISLMPEEQVSRFRDMGSDNTSQSRLDYWEAGWDMMKDYP
ncbi:O-antigen ligase, partial [Saccharospirillum sp. MSK14-1]|uniref:O-antigen ligase family protein n=1 Tax=Saccharospirillum sp. MSK14-1 TaxID=1897632 RepID=UPI001304DFA3